VNAHPIASADATERHVPLYRQEALDRYLRGEEELGAMLRVSPPWAWSLFLALAALVGVALALSITCRVELTSRGRGILRAVGGVRALETQVAGVVDEVVATSGRPVRAGDPLVRLQSATVKAELLEADARLAQAKATLETFSSKQEALYASRTSLLAHRADLLRARIASQAGTVSRVKKKAASYDDLGQKGIVGSLSADDANEELAQARRQKIGLEEDLSQTQLQIAALQSDRENERWRYQRDVADAQTKRDAVAIALDQTTVKAPQDGTLEAIVVKPGDVLHVGSPVGKLIPQGGPTQVISFLPEKDRAFVKEGTEVRVEIDQLPYAEFGALRGRIDRVSSALASPYEVSEALGEGAQLPSPAYRVELTVIEDETDRKLAPELRPGMLVSARYSLRQRKLIALVLDPLERWIK
jgi:multidrug resistance efflux pump